MHNFANISIRLYLANIMDDDNNQNGHCLGTDFFSKEMFKKNQTIAT